MQTQEDPARLAARYRETRARTVDLTVTLSAEDMQVQSMNDASPTKWHLGHTTWFFETFVLEARPDFVPVDPDYRVIFNSYYEQVGEKHPRPQRGMLTRPPLNTVMEYRQRIDDSMGLVLEGDIAADVAAVVELGLNHEEQHQELLLMDIKHVLGLSPLQPAFRAEPPPAAGAVTEQKWHLFRGGTKDIGHDGGGFAYDNEAPQHKQIVGDFKLAHRLVTNREWLEFINDSGYDDPLLWLSDGWAWREEHGITAPATWRNADGWTQFTLHGREELRLEDPATHLSYYEAEAFARWAEARLATEAEWETAATGQAVEGHFLTGTSWHPRPATGPDNVPAQLFGDAWEWTQSSYSAYPGYRPAAGAVGEYNGKFMANQFVLRGGCFATATGHVRASYRNFFHPHTRWHFSGVRLARDV
ncbi:ergothioneine biosynthesis protein EgtB [bacterium]|nr:MAG: ergothioneine biosynthesis protein EgtB [bacterium]RKZ15579.1 MAG: ergothioneine biosynthesis protein EgtB [bacterium]